MTKTKKAFNKTETKKIRERWDEFAGTEHDLAYRRAELLHEVWVKLERDQGLLRRFLAAELDETGKRAASYIRSVHSFSKNWDRETWSKIGALGVARLLKVRSAAKRNQVMREVDGVLSRTGRSNVSMCTFRNVLLKVLGAKAYKATCTEGQARPRQELRALRAFLLEIIRTHPSVRKKLTPDVREALGLNIFTPAEAS